MLTRLRLATGTAAELLAPLPDDGELLLFSAKAIDVSDDWPTRIVVVHPPPPGGASPGALLERMAAIHIASHLGLAAPLASGAVDDRGWIVEPTAPPHTVAARLAEVGGLATDEVIRLLRSAARPLLALHRAGVAHGALTAASIAWRRNQAVIHQLGRSCSTDPQQDWRALAALVRPALTKPEEVERARAIGLLTVLDQLEAAGRTGPPIAGEAVLKKFDRFPTTWSGELRFGHGGRSRSGERGALLLAVVATAFVLVWLLLRWR